MSQQSYKDSSQKTSSPTPQGKAGGHFLKLRTWNPSLGEAEFYVQAKGQHAGRPLTEPIANCWAVFTDVPHLMQIADSIYASGHLQRLLVGSVIPFIRLREYRAVLSNAVERAEAYDQKHLETLGVLHSQIEHLSRQAELLREYHRLMCIQINNHLFPSPQNP